MNMSKIILVTCAAIVALIISGCSGIDSEEVQADSSKRQPVDYSDIFSFKDTVRKSIIDVCAPHTFEEAAQQSLINKDFYGTTQYLDSAVLFLIDYEGNTLMKMTRRDSVIDALNNVVQSVNIVDYAFYRAESKTNAESILYILKMRVLYNEQPTEIGILFAMNSGIITAIKLY